VVRPSLTFALCLNLRAASLKEDPAACLFADGCLSGVPGIRSARANP
jgi:hypothetical protein